MTHPVAWGLSLALVGGLVVAAPTEAQEDDVCPRNLALATQRYDEGQFDLVHRR